MTIIKDTFKTCPDSNGHPLGRAFPIGCAAMPAMATPQSPNEF